jgi:RNA polymerase sigma-70 factor (ECF subfamily)
VTGNTSQSSDESSTRLSLLDQARGGDDAAWGRLVDLYGPVVLRWCRSLGLPPHAAEDACQETFAAVARSLTTFHKGDGGSFRGWLLTIARNKARDLARRDRRQPAVAAGGTEARERVAAAAAPDLDREASVESDRCDVLRRALAVIRGDFDERTWTAFWAAAVDGRASAEVGAELGLSPNAVRKAKARVLRRLREEFEGLLPGL